jgi:LPXTG-motif cell wall-anchored protein
MSIRQRVAARLGTVSVIAGTAIAIAAAPAYAAADADLGVSLSGTTIAATSSGKVFDVTITNGGGGTATGVTVTFDLSGLDQDRVEFVVPTGEDGAEVCDVDGDIVTCGVQDVPDGQNLDLGAELTRLGGTGEAGTITVSVGHDGTDPNESNNLASADVTVGDSGPDLFVYAPDVPFNLETNQTEGSVAPGGTTRLYYVIGNQGDVATTGLKVTVTLPPQIAFVEVEEDCEYNADNTVATCTYEDLPLVPVEEEDPANDVFSARLFFNDLRVDPDADVPAPSALAGGIVAVEPIVAEEQAPTRRQAAALPDNVLEVPESLDVDRSDNTDEFSVYVAAASGGGGGGDGELPITGAKAGLFGGVGLAVLAAGAVLLVIARRRRVVLVAPRDETPTA